MRGLLRWLRRLAISVLVVAVVVLAVALVTAHTGWGREQLRRRIEAALQDGFPGARVAALDGSLLGTLTLHDVELVRPDRGVRVTVRTLHVAVALWPLLFQTARLDRLIAEDVHAVVAAPQPALPARTAAASAWRIELPGAAIHRATVEIERARLVLDDLDIAGGMSLAAGRAVVSGSLRGRWRRADAPAVELTAQGTAVIEGGVQVPAALVRLDGAVIGATAVTVDLDRARGAAAVVAPASAIARLVPELACAAPCLGDVAAAIDLAPGGGDATRLAVVASAGAARLWAALRGEPARRTARAIVSLESIDLGLATRGRLGGRGSALAVFDAVPGGARGAVIAHGDVDLPGQPIRRAGVAILGRLDGATALVLGSGDDALQAAAVGSVRVRDGAVVVDSARAAARGRAIELLGQRITGELRAAAGITGTLGPHPDLVIRGDADGEHLALDPDGGARRIAVAALRSTFTLTARPAPDRPTEPEVHIDRVHVAATGIWRAGQRLGDAQVDLARRDGPGGTSYDVAVAAQPPGGVIVASAATVTQVGSGYLAALGDSRVTLPGGAVWTGRGGRVEVTSAASAPAIAATGLALHRGDAAVAVRGDYVGATGAITVHAEGDRIAASAIDARLRGMARGTLDLGRRGGRWRADAQLAVDDLAVSVHAAPIAGTAHLALAEGRATVDAHATGRGLGTIDLAFDAAAPRDPFDLAAWRRSDRAQIRSAQITAHEVALRGLAGQLGSRAPSGTIDGTVDLAPAVLRGGFAVRGVELPVGTLEGDVSLAPLDGDLGAYATARLVGVGDADVTARFAVPLHPFDPDSWQHRGRDLVREVAADLDDVAFDPELLARLGIARWLADHGLAAPYRGHARAALALGAAAGEARLAVELRGVTGGALVAPLSPRVAISADRSGTHVHAALLAGAGGDRGDDRGLGVLDGDVPMTAERWLDDPAAVLRAPITARWTLPETEAAAVLAILGRRELRSGTLEGSATIRGTVGTPIVPEARLTARDVAVVTPPGGRSAPVLRSLEAQATWGGASGRVTVTARESSGGELRAELDGRPDALAAATGTAALHGLDIAPITVFLPGALVAVAGTLDGDLALRPGAQVTGKLHVTGGALPLAAAIGTVREATADLASDGRTITAALDGRLGRGRIRIAGDGPSDLASANLRIHLDGISPILSIRPLVTADLTARLRRDAGQLRGEVVVERDGTIALTGRTGARLLDPALPADLVLAGASAAPRGPRAPAHPWLVAGVTLCPIRIDARDAFDGVSFTARLRSAAQPGACDRSTRPPPSGPLEVSIGDAIGVRGRIEIQSDDVRILGQPYLVEPTHDGPSSLTFDGTTDPLLDVRVSRQFPDLTLYIDEHSRLSKLEKARLSSDAGGYTENQLMAFVLGRPPSTDPNSEPPRDRTQELVAGGTRFLTGKVRPALNQILPIKVDTVSCELTSASTTSTTTTGSCSVGKWLSDQLFVGYRGRILAPPDENANEVQFQRRLGDSTLFEATGGDRGIIGADLLWRHRW